MHDLVIRGGTVVDGTGAAGRTADVAVSGGRIAEVGRVDGRTRRVVDADGLLVTPGFVDVHTHYDGQATWDPLLTPSVWHGVTTVVMGNCGVGFAPAEPERRQWLVGLMEGVEDIPGAALSDGIRWEWESFGEFLDALERMPRALDIGTQVPHAAVRAYVMGDECGNETATPEQVEKMAEIVRGGLAAGALGFTTSRTTIHRAVDGTPVPGTWAAEDELLAMAQVIAEHGRGVFELAPAGIVGEDVLAPEQELGWIRRVAEATGVRISFLMNQHDADPRQWERMLDLARSAWSDGLDVRPQVQGRPVNVLVGHETTFNPFSGLPRYREELADLPLHERVQAMRRDDVRASLLADEPDEHDLLAAIIGWRWDRIFPLGDPPDYEPPPEASIAACAARDGRDPKEVVYDELLRDDGRAMLMFAALNYADGDLEPVRTMLNEPRVMLGGSDGGAHCGTICDASMPTFMLTHWSRDRTRGARLPLEWVVKKQTADTASAYGFADRGTVRPGARADLNVVDYDRLQLRTPRVVRDLPSGASRLVQRADGYRLTAVAGQVIAENGEDTGARPGRLVRG